MNMPGHTCGQRTAVWRRFCLLFPGLWGLSWGLVEVPLSAKPSRGLKGWLRFALSKDRRTNAKVCHTELTHALFIWKEKCFHSSCTTAQGQTSIDVCQKDFWTDFYCKAVIANKLERSVSHTNRDVKYPELCKQLTGMGKWTANK